MAGELSCIGSQTRQVHTPVIVEVERVVGGEGLDARCSRREGKGRVLTMLKAKEVLFVVSVVIR